MSCSFETTWDFTVASLHNLSTSGLEPCERWLCSPSCTSWEQPPTAPAAAVDLLREEPLHPHLPAVLGPLWGREANKSAEGQDACKTSPLLSPAATTVWNPCPVCRWARLSSDSTAPASTQAPAGPQLRLAVQEEPPSASQLVADQPNHGVYLPAC